MYKNHIIDITMTKKKKLSRRKFVQAGGSAVAGGGLLLLSGALLTQRTKRKKEISSRNSKDASSDKPYTTNFVSPYQLTSVFEVPDGIFALELVGDLLAVATEKAINVFDHKGSLQKNIQVDSDIRDLATDGTNLYVLHPASIDVFDLEGENIRSWDACSDLSDYCSMVVVNDVLFVTDAENKNICKYTTEGGLVKFINSPNGFIIPSYSFDIVYSNGKLFCSNSGRHMIESFDLDGNYLGSFGKAGADNGMFCGCCNPAHLAVSDAGEIITSEKGIPRISCYSPNGEFRNMLIDTQGLGGGTVGRDIRMSGERLYLSDNQSVYVYQSAPGLASNTLCSKCGINNCPIKRNINV